MSRPLLALLAACAALLLALPAAAQVPSAGGSLAITGLASTLSTNQTQATLPFTVQVRLNQGTCVGGTGDFQVQLTATKTGGNGTASVSVQPSSLTFRVGQSDTLTGTYTGSGSAVIVVSPGLVRENATVPVTVKAATTVVCSVPGAGMAPGALSAEGSTTLKFMPVSEEVRNGPTEPVPGLGVPALLAIIGLALLLRRKA